MPRPKQSFLVSASEVRRQRDAACASVRDPVYGTQLGWLHDQGHLTESLYAAGKRWAGLTQEYAEACQAPRQPSTVSLEPSSGNHPPDVDSITGLKIMRRHRRAVANFTEGRNALRRAGRDVLGIVDAIVIADRATASAGELQALKIGLQALADLSIARRKRDPN